MMVEKKTVTWGALLTYVQCSATILCFCLFLVETRATIAGADDSGRAVTLFSLQQERLRMFRYAVC